MAKEEIDVDTTQLVDEVHVRIDALLELLEEKGLISEAEYVKKIDEVLERESNEDQEE